MAGGKRLAGLAAEFDAFKIADAQTLSSTVAWDSITTPGEYYISSATGTNVPVSGASYFVKVFKNGSVLKQVARIQGASVTIERFTTGVSWGTWDTSFARSNILGTVSQLSGIPTGAIIERGSNANGDYVKFTDGTLICAKAVTVPVWAAGASSGASWTFPSSFSSTYAGSITLITTIATNGPHTYNSSGTVTSGTSANIYGGGTTAIGSPPAVYCLAIGRWF